MKRLFSFFSLIYYTACFAQQYKVTDEYLKWPSDIKGSTHELAMNDNHFYITGQNMHHIAKVDHNGGITYYNMPDGSGPHGILFDANGKLWVSLEFYDQVVQLDKKGNIVKSVDVSLKVPGSKPIRTSPHGIGLDADGETIWFTGKRTSTIGKINPDGSVQHFELETLAALPIYLHAGPDGNMWGTELQGNKILKITPEGEVSEYRIPTHNSRPIVIKPDPNGKYMWFSQEAGKQIGRIDMQGNIKEFQIPYYQPNEILAGLCFDAKGNLWTQSYIDQNNPYPSGTDYIIRLNHEISKTEKTDLSNVEVTHFPIPTKKTVMHRIKAGKDGNIYFTELKQDKLGTVKIIK